MVGGGGTCTISSATCWGDCGRHQPASTPLRLDNHDHSDFTDDVSKQRLRNLCSVGCQQLLYACGGRLAMCACAIHPR